MGRSSLPPEVSLPANRRVRHKKPPAKIEPTPRSGAEPEEPAVAVARSSVFPEGLRAALGVLATVAAAVLCVFGLVRYTRQSPRFSIRQIQVEGISHLAAGTVAVQGDIVAGHNIFTTDLEWARARILENPWVEKVSLSRKLPQTVRIDVSERDAAALVSLGSELYLTSRSGEIFKKLDLSDPYDLPVVTGLSLSDVVKDRTGTALAVRRALDLLSEFERIGAARSLPVDEIHMGDDGSLSLFVGHPSLVLRMGKGPYRQALENSARVLSEVAAKRVSPEVIFLDNQAHPERVVVRMR